MATILADGTDAEKIMVMSHSKKDFYPDQKFPLAAFFGCNRDWIGYTLEICRKMFKDNSLGNSSWDYTILSDSPFQPMWNFL
jgi:hypothetical protein